MQKRTKTAATLLSLLSAALIAVTLLMGNDVLTGSVVAIVFTAIWYLIRKLATFSALMDQFWEGFTGMFQVFAMLAMAFAFKDACANLGCDVFNLGTGTGYSVLDMVKAFREANNVPLPYVIAPRRPGDIAVCYADPAKSREKLGWKAEKTLQDMCRDSWNWQKNNPNGYE